MHSNILCNEMLSQMIEIWLEIQLKKWPKNIYKE